MTADPGLDFLYLDEPDMIAAGVTDMAACVDTMADVLALFARGDYRMAGHDGLSHGAMLSFPEHPVFPGMPADGPDRRFMAMPAYLGGHYRTTGCKWYGSNVENRRRGLPRSILMFTLNDTDTGAPLAIMSANLLSAYRTGAVPGVGARYLAREGARTIGVVGPGPINRASFEAFMAVRPAIDAVKVYGIVDADVAAFIAWVREHSPSVTTVEAVDTMEAAVRGSDIVSIAVPSPSGSQHYPFIVDDWVQPGALVFCPSHLALDEALVRRARHVVDARRIYEVWVDEVPAPAFETVGLWGVNLVERVRDGRMPAERFEDLGEIIPGIARGREHEDEVFVFGTGGLPVQDVAWATKVYRNALERGIGTRLRLWDAPALS